ncbi:putative transmembrane protein [Clostridium botulinum CFSAN002367]|nr:putative transmembrane protein [Clostridium botulinum CFSAN002367]
MSELQMMHVANVCDGYDSIDTGFVSVIGAKNSKSCTNCKKPTKWSLCKKSLR